MFSSMEDAMANGGHHQRHRQLWQRQELARTIQQQYLQQQQNLQQNQVLPLPLSLPVHTYNHHAERGCQQQQVLSQLQQGFVLQQQGQPHPFATENAPALSLLPHSLPGFLACTPGKAESVLASDSLPHQTFAAELDNVQKSTATAVGVTAHSSCRQPARAAKRLFPATTTSVPCEPCVASATEADGIGADLSDPSLVLRSGPLSSCSAPHHNLMHLPPLQRQAIHLRPVDAAVPAPTPKRPKTLLGAQSSGSLPMGPHSAPPSRSRGSGTGYKPAVKLHGLPEGSIFTADAILKQRQANNGSTGLCAQLFGPGPVPVLGTGTAAGGLSSASESSRSSVTDATYYQGPQGSTFGHMLPPVERVSWKGSNHDQLESQQVGGRGSLSAVVRPVVVVVDPVSPGAAAGRTAELMREHGGGAAAGTYQEISTTCDNEVSVSGFNYQGPGAATAATASAEGSLCAVAVAAGTVPVAQAGGGCIGTEAATRPVAGAWDAASGTAGSMPIPSPMTPTRAGVPGAAADTVQGTWPVDQSLGTDNILDLVVDETEWCGQGGFEWSEGRGLVEDALRYILGPEVLEEDIGVLEDWDTQLSIRL